MSFTQAKLTIKGTVICHRRPDHLVPKFPSGIGHFTMRSHLIHLTVIEASGVAAKDMGGTSVRHPMHLLLLLVLIFIYLLLLFLSISPLSSTVARWTTRTRTASSTSTAARPRPRSSENLWFVSFFAVFFLLHFSGLTRPHYTHAPSACPYGQP